MKIEDIRAAVARGEVSREELIVLCDERVAPMRVEVLSGSMRVYERAGCHGVWIPPEILAHMGAEKGELLYPLLGPSGEIRLLGEKRYHSILASEES